MHHIMRAACCARGKKLAMTEDSMSVCVESV